MTEREKKLVALLEKVEFHLVNNLCRGCGRDEEAEALCQSIDAALSEVDQPAWETLPDGRQRAAIYTSPQRRLLFVEKNKAGWWASVDYSLVNCFDTEDKAKAAAIRSAGGTVSLETIRLLSKQKP